MLARMPTSCAVAFDVLRAWAAGEALDISVRELAAVCRLSYGATWRALRRLRGANLVRWQTYGRGRGQRSTLEVLWDRPRRTGTGRARFPQVNDPPMRGLRNNAEDTDAMQHAASPSRARYPYPQGLTSSLTDAERPESEPPATGKAFRWAMAQVRAEVRRWPIPWAARNRVIRGCAVALSRAMARGEVCVGPELGAVVRGLVARLRMAEAISGDLGAAVRFARWAVRGAAAVDRGGQPVPEGLDEGRSEARKRLPWPLTVPEPLTAGEAERPATVAEVAAALARWRGEYMGCVYPGRGGAGLAGARNAGGRRTDNRIHRYPVITSDVGPLRGAVGGRGDQCLM